jgi:hypothetical protein
LIVNPKTRSNFRIFSIIELIDTERYLQYWYLTTYFFIGPKYDEVGCGSGSVINVLPGSQSVIRIYGSTDPDPEEIFTDSEHGIVGIYLDSRTNLLQIYTNADANQSSTS